jgi:hypothetical protein
MWWRLSKSLCGRGWVRQWSQKPKIDVKALIDCHGERFGEQILQPELGITSESFLQSLWSLMQTKRYRDVLKAYDLLPKDHPFKSQDVSVIAILASSGSSLPKKVRIADENHPLRRLPRRIRSAKR